MKKFDNKGYNEQEMEENRESANSEAITKNGIRSLKSATRCST